MKNLTKILLAIFVVFSLYGCAPSNQAQPHSDTDLPGDKLLNANDYLSIWDREMVGQKIVSDINDISADNAKVITVDRDLSQKFISTAKYKNEQVLWKGYKTGQLGDKYIKISNYGHFFAVNGIDGYFVIDNTLSDEWDNLIREFTYSPNLTGFKEYNKLLPIGIDSTMGHVIFNFSYSDDKLDNNPIPDYDCCEYSICWHGGGVSSDIAIYDFLIWKYNCGVKLSKYFYDKSDIKLLYEDGTYFEWCET